MLDASNLRRTVCGLALFCGMLTTPVSAQTLPQILLDMGTADESAVRAEATSQATSEPRYRSRTAGEVFLFTGPFVPESANTKHAIFSDDGCTVRIDGNAVHSRSGQGQHLPDLSQSFHVIDFTFEAGRSYNSWSSTPTRSIPATGRSPFAPCTGRRTNPSTATP